MSSAPVGSSAKITAGRVTSARAIATRCCWPPDSSPGRCLRRSAEPDLLEDRAAPARPWHAGRRAAAAASRCPATVSAGSRLNAWKTNPTRSRRSRVSSTSDSSARSWSSTSDRAAGGPVEAGRAVQEGALAGTGRAHHRGEGGPAEADAHPVQRGDAVAALAAVGLADVGQPHDVRGHRFVHLSHALKPAAYRRARSLVRTRRTGVGLALPQRHGPGDRGAGARRGVDPQRPPACRARSSRCLRPRWVTPSGMPQPSSATVSRSSPSQSDVDGHVVGAGVPDHIGQRLAERGAGVVGEGGGDVAQVAVDGAARASKPSSSPAIATSPRTDSARSAAVVGRVGVAQGADDRADVGDGGVELVDGLGEPGGVLAGELAGGPAGERGRAACRRA